MRVDWLLEPGPWQTAEDEIRKGTPGKVVQICLQEVLGGDAKPALADWLDRWQQRLEPLVGKVVRKTVHQTALAVSALLETDAGTIVRLFADAATISSSPCLSFEVIGTKASMIHRWAGSAPAEFHVQRADGSCQTFIDHHDSTLAEADTPKRPDKPIRLGVISIEHPHSTFNHFIPLQKSGHSVKLVAIADPNRAACEPWLKEFGADYYADRDEMLANPDIDAVLVTSQNWQHSEDTIAAANAGKDVLCDKPIATNIEDTLAMVEACQKNKVRFITTYPCRFQPPILRLKGLIDSGDLGEIQAIMATNHGCMYDPGAPEWVQDPKLNGGGCIIDHTVHVGDMIRWLTGQEYATAQTFAASTLRGIKGEDIASTHGTMTGGTVFQIDCSWSRKGSDPMWGDVLIRIVGTKGSVSMDLYNNEAIQVLTADGVEFRYTCGIFHQHAMVFYDYQAERTTGVKGLNADEIDGLRTMELVFASYESLKTGKEVTIKRN